MPDKWEPQNPRFKERVEQSFAQQPMLKTMGALLKGVEPGYCEVHLPFKAELGQHHGYLHGGAYALLLDAAGGYAAYTLISADDSALTVEYKVNMLRPGNSTYFLACAHVVKPGKTLSIVKADLYLHDADGAEQLCATSLQTIMVMKNVKDNSN